MFVPRVLLEYCPHSPFPTQSAFLLYQGLEAFYGGAAGGPIRSRSSAFWCRHQMIFWWYGPPRRW
jgi:hypothetical protein